MRLRRALAGRWGILFAVIGLAGAVPTFAAEPAEQAASKTPPIVGRQVANFKLPDHRGQKHALSELADRKLVVLAMLGTECPLATRYAARLSALAVEYEPRGVAILGIDANRQDSLAEIAELVREHDLKFRLLKDVGNRVADHLGAVRTPEVFVLDEKRIVRYYGRIDDQYGLGFARDKPQRRDLAEALEELLAGKPVSVATTEPTGCRIGRDEPARADSPVTYSNQIARILARHCVACHRAGEAAPFALTEYEEVAGWAGTIVEVVDQGRMPPWHANPEHGKFANDSRLSDEEKALLKQWSRAGAPQGDPKQAPEPQQYIDGWNLPKQPDLVIKMDAKPFHVPADGVIKYQYYRIDPKFTSEKWIVAADVRPGNRAVVHHALVVLRPPGADDSDVANLDEQILGSYTPGTRAELWPPGLAKRVPVGSHVEFELHYTSNGTAQEDLTEIGLVFANPQDVRRAVITGRAMQMNFSIPAGDADYRLEMTLPPSSYEVELLSLMPHMHLRGKSFLYEAIFADGTRETLLDVPHYDFNWQTSYRLAEPKHIPAGTKMHCVAHFDNSADNPANPDSTVKVNWGRNSWQEMMIGYFEYSVPVDVVRDGGDRPAPRTPAEAARRVRAVGLMRRYDKNGDGRVTASELPLGQRSLIASLDTDGDDAITFDELLKSLSGK